MLTTFDSLSERIQTLEEELKHVFSDWNDLVKAIGAPKNGIAIGHVKALVAERDKWKAKAEAMETRIRNNASRIMSICDICVHVDRSGREVPCNTCKYPENGKTDNATFY